MKMLAVAPDLSTAVLLLRGCFGAAGKYVDKDKEEHDSGNHGGGYHVNLEINAKNSKKYFMRGEK